MRHSGLGGRIAKRRGPSWNDEWLHKSVRIPLLLRTPIALNRSVPENVSLTIGRGVRGATPSHIMGQVERGR